MRQKKAKIRNKNTEGKEQRFKADEDVVVFFATLLKINQRIENEKIQNKRHL